jgi:hypothetical protein
LHGQRSLEHGQHPSDDWQYPAMPRLRIASLFRNFSRLSAITASKSATTIA